MREIPYLSVGALTKYVKRKFEADPHLRNVYVKGELSNVNIHSSGHIYFTLKDEKSQIRSAMFRSAASTLKFRPESGMTVFIQGDVSVYEVSGQYQLYVHTMQPDGVGALYLAYEQLKEQLRKEGLFNGQWKSDIPAFPNKIGVVTAQTGAAIRDICSTIERRYQLAEIILFPAIVQGKQAAPSIVKSIEQANSYDGIDVLIVGRGGGSIEDLWAFNEEIVARAIFSSKIPVISAVGHETDTTIADFVADRRAPTPTAAAEMAVPSKEELFERILIRKRALFTSFSNKIKSEQKRLLNLQTSYPLQYPERLYRPFTEKLIGLEERLKRSGQEMTRHATSELTRLSSLLHYYSPKTRVREESKSIQALEERLERTITHNLQTHRERFTSSVRMLQALNPLHVMERGYSIVYQNDQVVNSVAELSSGQQIAIRLHDGSLRASIDSITSTDEKEGK